MDFSEQSAARPNCPDCVTAGERCTRCWHAQTRTFFYRDGVAFENMDLGHEIVLGRHDDKPFLRNGNYYFLWEGDVEGGWGGDTGVTRLRVMEFTDKRMDMPEDPDSVHEFWEFELVDDRMPRADLERLIRAVGQAGLADLAEQQNQLLRLSKEATPADYRPVLREWFQNCDEECHEHEWVVFSTALAQGWLMLQCVRCGRHGTVDDPSKKEWSDAYHAPSAPYRWADDGRVTRRDIGPLYVRASEHGGYERLWREVIGKLDPLGDDERAELLHLAGLVEGPADLDSGLFPLFVTNFELDTRVVPCPGVKRAADRIGRFHQRGVHLSPRQVAWALRCYANESPPAVPATGSSQPAPRNPQG